jgi:MurNAc alpha-1-phosphate uridylyltransferase
MGGAPQTAMALAAGLGKRMRPYTDNMPKPLLRVAGKPLIDYALDRFAAAGVEKTVVNVHYFADQLIAHLRSRAHPEIVISDERDRLLETGGGLKKARPHFDMGPIFCTNTDAILIDAEGDEACAVLARAWDEDAMDALLLLVLKEKTSGYGGAGDFDRNAAGRISLRQGASAPFVFTGLQMIAPALIDEGPDGPFSTRLLWDRAQARGRLFGAVYNGFWMHVGDAEGLKAAEKRLAGEGA